jgi:prevent-host-death family protein
VLSRVPEILPISDLVRDARAVIEQARKRREPVIITQRGRETAVLIPIELYREMERGVLPKIASPSLVRPEDIEHFRMEMIVDDEPEA